MADFAPAALTEALGEPTYGVSLDNSIRFAGMAQTEWILLDIQVEAVFRGVAQIAARMFSQDGQLLAIAGQSAMTYRMEGRRRRRTANTDAAAAAAPRSSAS
jgi:acyl-CoA thioesterase